MQFITMTTILLGTCVASLFVIDQGLLQMQVKDEHAKTLSFSDVMLNIENLLNSHDSPIKMPPTLVKFFSAVRVTRILGS